MAIGLGTQRPYFLGSRSRARHISMPAAAAVTACVARQGKCVACPQSVYKQKLIMFPLPASFCFSVRYRWV
jgi:hypothetical protein